MTSSDSIEIGNYVAVMKNFDTDNLKIFAVQPGTIVHYGKLHFDPAALVGAEYGWVFEIKDGIMCRVLDFDDYNTQLSVTVSEKMASFDEKSQFSQEKLINKKKKLNYSHIVTVIRPSLLLIQEMLYARDKLGGLRQDALSQMMTSANIRAGAKCLVLDHNLGVVTCAVASRVLPTGMCIQLLPDYEALCTTRKTLKMLNLNENLVQERVLAITIRDLYTLKRESCLLSDESSILQARGLEQIERLASFPTRTVKDQETGNKKLVSVTDLDKDELTEILLRKDANRELRNNERAKVVAQLKPWSMDSLVLVTQFDHPLPILKLAYQYLAPSGQFVIYSDTVEPLLECHQHLKSNSLAVCLSVSESWLRRFQVLPDRTRPDMTTTGFGGFVLSGTKAFTGDNVDICQQQSVALEAATLEA